MTERYFAVEGIHDLRVEIKKIRALFRFIEQLKPSFESGPLLDKMRQLFRTAGKMRDIDIQQGIIQKEITRLDVSELINYLKHQELKGRPKLEKLCDDFDNHILMGNLKRMRAAMGNVSAAELQAPMRSILEKHAHDLIKVANKTRPTNDDLHTIRKSSKSLRYELDIWQHCYGGSPKITSLRNKLTTIFDHLGEWRDNMLTLSTLDSFLKNDAPPQLFDRTSYIKMRQKLRTQGQNLLKEYRKAWQLVYPELRNIGRPAGD